MKPIFIFVCSRCSHNFKQEPPPQLKCVGCGSNVERWVPQSLQSVKTASQPAPYVFMPPPFPDTIPPEDLAPVGDAITARFADMDFGAGEAAKPAPFNDGVMRLLDALPEEDWEAMRAELERRRGKA